MNVKTAYILIKDRLNKLSTDHNQEITKRQFVYAFNKMQLHWFEQRVKGEEIDKVRQEELQQFVTDLCKSPKNNKKGKYYTIDMPDDYFHYKRVSAEASKAGCEHIVYGRATEESSMNILLKDSFQKPSFDWQDSLFTVGDNKIRFYHNDDFKVSNIYLVYYRCPKEIDMEGVEHIGRSGVNCDPELDKVNLQEVLDLTVRLLSGDIMDQGRYQITNNRISEHN